MDSEDYPYEHLTPEELVANLDRGSKTADEMRATINNVVGAILGLLSFLGSDTLRTNQNNTSREKKFFKFDFVAGECVWTYSGVYELRGEITCWFGKPGYVGRHGYSSNSGASGISLRNVAAVYKALPILVGGVRNAIPEIQAAWKPLLDLANESSIR